MTYVRDPFDTDEPPCLCGTQAPGPVTTTPEFCPACGDPDKPAPEPPHTEDPFAPPGCPDGGTCHHACPSAAACLRVAWCGPLTGEYPGDDWPAGWPESARGARDGHMTAEDVIAASASTEGA